MHLALPTLLPGRRYPRRSATLIRRRTTRRKSRSWKAAVLVSALAVASAGLVLAVVARTLRPLPLIGRFIQELAQDREGALLCCEQISEAKWCHRMMVSAWLNEQGQECAEL
jgi:hypothetical protein